MKHWKKKMRTEGASAIKQNHGEHLHSDVDMASHVHPHHTHGHHHGDETSGHTHRHVHPHEETVRIRNRLARAIGHLESVKRMVEDDRDCTEILIQLAAVRSAINNTGKQILKEHLSHCVVEAIEAGDQSELESLNRVIDSFMK